MRSVNLRKPLYRSITSKYFELLLCQLSAKAKIYFAETLGDFAVILATLVRKYNFQKLSVEALRLNTKKMTGNGSKIVTKGNYTARKIQKTQEFKGPININRNEYSKSVTQKNQNIVT